MPRSDSRRALLLTTIFAAALLLAGGLSALGLIAARSLRERDRAVQEGALLRLAHDLEAQLRERGPADPAQRLEEFLRAHGNELAGIELAGPSGTIGSAGRLGPNPVETNVALGPSWRDLAGGGEMARFGRGYPPFRLRLTATADAGSHERIARMLVAGSAIAAVALFAFASLAALGMLEREKRFVLQAERRQLEVAALAGAGLAHRIRTPLATIKGTAQMLEGQLTERGAERARRIVSESERVDAMIRRLLEFARPPEPAPESFDVMSLVKRVGRDGEVRVAGPESLAAFADPEQIEMVIDELVSNARAFDSGPIEIVAASTVSACRIEVRDRGAGLSIAAERALDPYVTTRADGTGLGLAIANALVRSNGGALTLENREGGGCVARIEIPSGAR
ncbi:MAG TPA: HAMP domain-containing sensor histidine kinase [Thermoanaerobaculia bacterium]|nr:HAMP domain-containing sensor histidine kinase [Thermoanaerobaculia bacterium]